MWHRIIVRSLTGIAIASLGVAIQPSRASADQWNPGASRPSMGEPIPPTVASGDNSSNSSNFNPVYDVSPAAGRVGFAEAQYQQANAGLIAITYHLQNEFHASNEYRSAAKAMEDAQAAYDLAAQPVMDQVRQNPEYVALVERRNRVDAALKSATLSAQGRFDLALRKMEYSAQAATLENASLQNDSAVRQARGRLKDAIQTLGAKEAQFQASLYSNPSVVEAKEAFDAAASNLAGARAALDGALLAREDTVDADRRRYSSQVTNYDPYYSGYYGFGTSFYGANVTWGRHERGR